MTNFEIIESDYAPQLMTYDGKTIALELKKTKYAESRLHDIQTANPGTLPELATVFLSSCHELNRALGVISTQLSLIKHKKEILSSHILIEKVPYLLEQTKQRSSEDVRNALIEMDPEYQKFKEWSLMLEAAYNNLKDKRKVVEMAYFSCQKIAEFKTLYQPMGSPNYGQYDAVQAGSDAAWA